MQLNGAKVLITGGTSGIGLKMVEALVREKAKVIVVARNKQKLLQLQKKQQLEDVYACDLSSSKEVTSLVEEVGKSHPDLQVIINNAAIQHNVLFDDTKSTYHSIEEEVHTNFLAPLLLIKGLLSILSSQKQAVIVNVTTGLALVPKSNAAVYCGTKGGLRIFTQALRNQIDDNIRVIEILPPVVDTPMTAGRGTNKISPAIVAEETINAMKNKKNDVYVKKTRMLYWLNRLSPSLAKRLMKKIG